MRPDGTGSPVEVDHYDLDGDQEVFLDRWLVPVYAEEPGFDIFRIEKGSRYKIRFQFIQVTVGKSHDWNPCHFASGVHLLQRNLPLTHRNIQDVEVDIVFAIPEKNASVFSIVKKGSVEPLNDIDERWTDSDFRRTIRIHSLANTDIFAASRKTTR